MGTASQRTPCPSFRNLTQPQEFQTWASLSFGRWLATVTPEERSAFRIYNTPGQYYSINAWIRTGHLPQNHERHSSLTVAQIQELTRIMAGALSRKEARLPENVTAYRVMDLPPQFQEAFDKGTLSGMTLTDPAFMSTTLDASIANGFELNRRWRKPTVLEIRIPAGTYGAYVSMLYSGFERELLLRPGTTLRFLKTDKDAKGVQRVLAEVVPRGQVKAGLGPANTHSLSFSGSDSALRRE